MDELAKRLAELAEKVDPQAMDTARAAVRVEAYSCFMSATVSLLLAIAFAIASKYLWQMSTVNDYDAGFPKFFGGLLGMAALICITITIWNIIDPWTWTAIYYPDLYLAKRILKL